MSSDAVDEFGHKLAVSEDEDMFWKLLEYSQGHSSAQEVFDDTQDYDKYLQSFNELVRKVVILADLVWTVGIEDGGFSEWVNEGYDRYSSELKSILDDIGTVSAQEVSFIIDTVLSMSGEGDAEIEELTKEFKSFASDLYDDINSWIKEKTDGYGVV